MAKRKTRQSRSKVAEGDKRPIGRPTAFRDEFPEQARKLCLLGATNEKLADFFGVAVSTVDKWLAEIPEFSGAVREGREDADANVARSLYQRALGYSHPAVKIQQYQGDVIETPYTEHYPPDTEAAKWWLRNRQPELWREKIEHQHTADSELLAALEAAGERARKAGGDQ